MATSNLKKMDLADAKRLFQRARKQYYEDGNSDLTDHEFDALEDRIRKEDPNWGPLHSTGVVVGKKSAVKLEFPMPSLDKLMADNLPGIKRWVGKVTKKYGPRMTAMLKLDGSAVQGTWKKGQLVKLVTRGDGITGKDISHFIPYVDLPRDLHYENAPVQVPDLLVIRFEAIMPRGRYHQKWRGQFDTARALASAVLNRQDVHASLKDLHFVALRILSDSNERIRSQLTTLSNLGFRVVASRICDPQEELTTEKAVAEFVDWMQTWRGECPYETDGVVLCSNRSEGLPEPTGERPDYARAFKVNDTENAIETVVRSIIWKPSAFGVLVPKALIKPIVIGGATIKHAALHNARWAMDKGAGAGAKVKVLRAGDIIPKIVEVVRKEEFILPDSSEFGAYEWDGVNIVLKGGSSAVSKQKITRFFMKLGMDKMSGGLAEKLVEAGFTETHQLPGMTHAQFAELPGVKKLAWDYYKAMMKVDGMPVVDLMLASGVFPRGIGESRLLALQRIEHRWLTPNAVKHIKEDPEQAIEILSQMKGVGPAFAREYVAHLPEFFKWLGLAGIKANYAKPNIAAAPTKGKYFGMLGTWTGYRSEKEEAEFTKHGGVVVSFGSKTNVLFYKEGGKTSGKIEKAIERGVRATTWADFINL